jgi:hypothetical protein
LPGTTSIINSGGFGSIGADGSSSIAWTDSDSNPTQISAITADGNTGVVIQAGAVAGGPPVPDYQWTFGNDGGLTLPGDIYGPATHDWIHPDQVNGHALGITPASDAPTKKFNFRIDQYGEPFTRAYLEMPPAEVDKQVAISFPHDNGTIGYIFTQGTNDDDDGMNNAFNLFYNSGDIKLTAEGPDGLKTYKFGNDGNLTVPNNILAQEGNDLAVQVFNPDAQGGVSFVVQNRQVDLDNDRTTQFEVTPQDIKLTTDFSGNKNEWTFGADGTIQFPVLSILDLPSPVAGLRAFVNNADNFVPWGTDVSTLGHAGNNTLPVWSDGYGWYVG